MGGRLGEAQPLPLANIMIRKILPDCKHSHNTFLMMENYGNRVDES